MQRQASPIDAYKKQATKLQTYLEQAGITLKRSHALEAIAQMHGFDDFHQLAFSTARGEGSGAEDVTKWVRSNAHDLWIDAKDVVTAWQVEDAIFAAYGNSEGIGAIYIPESRHKVYNEGEAFANDCPHQVLSVLTPTENIQSLLWREGAWIRNLRRDLLADEDHDDFVPWMLLAAGREISGFRPVLAARSSIKSRIYGVCNWKESILKMTDSQWEIGCSYLSLDGERPLDQVDQELRNPRGWKWLELGVAPFRLWVMVSDGGGYVTWTADPWHFSTCIQDSFRGDDLESLPNPFKFRADLNIAQPVFELAARARAPGGKCTYETLKSALLGGAFDPVFPK